MTPVPPTVRHEPRAIPLSETVSAAGLDAARSFLRRVNGSRVLSVVLALAFPLLTIQTGQLFGSARFRQTLEWPLYRFGWFSSPIVGLAHGRPLEVCPSIDKEFADYIDAQPRQRRIRGFRQLIALVRDNHRRSRAILMGPCPSGWVWKPGSLSHLYAQFARDAPVAWIFGRLGGSEVLIALFILTSALVGTYGFGRLAFRLTSSNVVLAFVLALFVWSTRELFLIFGIQVLWAMYGVLTCWLVTSFNQPSPHRSRVVDWLLVAALIVHLAGYLVVAYSVALGPVALSIGAIALPVAARPSRARALRLAIVATGVWLVVWDCSAFSKRQLAPISSLNFTLGGSFGEMALSTGFWTERPNPVSYPLGDGGVFAAYLAEPFIRDHATWMYEYQGYQAFGAAFLHDTVGRHPATAVAGALKRVLLLIVRLPVLSQPIFKNSPRFIRLSQVTAAGALVLALVIAWRPSRWDIELPLFLIPLWNVFGIAVLTHLVHTHSSYYVFGLIQLALLAPVLVIAAANDARRLLPLPFAALRRRRALILACAAVLMVVGVVAYRGARRELRTFDIWYHPWVGMYRTPLDRAALEPAVVQQKIEGLRTLGEATPGSISMYGVWMMSRLDMYSWAPEAAVGQRLQMTADEIAARRKDAVSRAVQYFARASAEAPDNAWALTFAYLWAPDRVPQLYARLLDDHPDHPFATWWAYVLMHRLPREQGARFAQRFDDLTHRQLVATKTLRPGFVAKPQVHGTGTSRDDGESTEVQLNPNDAVLVGSSDAYGSDRLGLMVSVHVTGGAVLGSLEVQTAAGIGRSEELRFGEGDASAIRMLKWEGSAPAQRMMLRLRAEGNAPAVVLVRDFYPMIENPHVASLD